MYRLANELWLLYMGTQRGFERSGTVELDPQNKITLSSSSNMFNCFGKLYISLENANTKC